MAMQSQRSSRKTIFSGMLIAAICGISVTFILMMIYPIEKLHWVQACYTVFQSSCKFGDSQGNRTSHRCTGCVKSIGAISLQPTEPIQVIYHFCKFCHAEVFRAKLSIYTELLKVIFVQKTAQSVAQGF